MGISSLQLDAFLALAKTLHFSKAAESVHITQSALSHRIRNLEEELGLTLVIRGPKDIRLTDAGARLLRYCRSRDVMESELIEEFKMETSGALGGWLRVAGYSTIMSSVVIPALAPFLVRNPRVKFSFQTRKMWDLPAILHHGQADWVLTDYVIERAGVESCVIGRETYVLVESAGPGSRVKTALDYVPEDETTERFFRRQSKRPPVDRAFLDDIHGVLAGVSLGLGRAVIPRHLIGRGLPIRVVRGARSIEVPVVLHYPAQPYYSRLHRAALDVLVKEVPARLARARRFNF